MREGGLISAVFKYIPPSLHSQSMTYASLTHNGTPDRYLDGSKSDLWTEWKLLRSMPRSGIAKGDYSPQQLRWMTRRWHHGKNVIGLVGLPNRTVCIQHTPEEWINGTTVTSAISYKETAAWILDFCGPSYGPSVACLSSLHP